MDGWWECLCGICHNSDDGDDRCRICGHERGEMIYG